MAAVRKAHAMAPSNAEVAIALSDIGAEEEAFDILQRAHRAHPTHARLGVHLAEELLADATPGGHARAIQLLEHAVATAPSAAALFLLGSAVEDVHAEEEMDARGAREKARELYTRALALDPQHVPSLVSSADLEEEANVAAALYRRAVALEPHGVTALRNWARRCEVDGQLDQAQTLCEPVCVAGCCRVLQGVAGCCRMLQGFIVQLHLCCIR